MGQKSTSLRVGVVARYNVAIHRKEDIPMSAETLGDDGSIPVSESVVNTECVEVCRLIAAAWDRHQRMVCECSFEIGRYFNRLGRFPALRQRMIERRFGEYLYKRFRRFGSIAHRWQGQLIDYGKSWDYYATHWPDGREVAPRPYVIPDVLEVKTESVAGGVRFTLSGPGDKESRFTLTWKRYCEIGASMATEDVE